MKAERGFVSHLKGNTEVRALVGDRVYRTNAPEDTTSPYVVVTRTPGTRREHHQTGASPIHGVQLLVDSFATTMNAAEDLGDVVRLALDGKVNGEIGLPPNTVNIASAVLTDDFLDTLITGDGAGVNLYRWNQTWFVWADETATVFA